jgi:hypothetical protein
MARSALMNSNDGTPLVAVGDPVDLEPRDEAVVMLHELRLLFPHENDAVLAQALLQARKNLAPNEGFEAIQREVGRLLGLLAVLKLKAEAE